MPTTAGIDIGSEAIKAVVLSSAKAGPVAVLAAGTLPLGELGHMEDSADKTLALGVKLKELVKSARIRAETRRVGVSGKNTSLRYLQVPPVPNWRLDMLVKYEVEEKSGDREPCCYDHRTLDVPEASGQDTILIGILKEAAAQEMMSMSRSAGLGQVELDLEALALYNAYYHGHGYDAGKTVLVVDIGADDITILLVKDGALFLARTMMGGGRRFTNVLADELKIDPLEAEEIKKSQGQIVFDMPATGRTTLRVPRPGANTAVIGRPSQIRPSPVLKTPGAAPLPLADPIPLEETPAASAVPAASTSAAAESDTSSFLSSDTLIETPAPDKDLELMPSGSSSASAPAAPLAPTAPFVPAPQAEASPFSESPSATPETLINSVTAPLDMSDDRRKRQISGVLVRETASLCAALENAVLFCRQQTKIRDLKVDRIYLSGGGSQLKGLLEFMGRRMRLEVQRLEPFKQLSLDRLPAPQAEELKAEQHALAIAVGLAVSNLQKGAFSFLFWPEALKQRKLFWARGAYLYYTGVLAVLSLVLFLWTPYRNIGELEANTQRAKDAIEAANKQEADVKGLSETYKEKYHQLRQIRDNVLSGHYFLNLLAELKNPARIGDDIYLTSISTNMPDVVRRAGGGEPEKTAAAAGAHGRAGTQATSPESSSFLAQRRVFLRGFARSGDKVKLIDIIQKFVDKLVPCPQTPDDPRNLFKQIDSMWYSPDDNQRGAFYLKEFVLVAYTEISKDKEETPAVDKRHAGKKPGGAK